MTFNLQDVMEGSDRLEFRKQTYHKSVNAIVRECKKEGMTEPQIIRRLRKFQREYWGWTSDAEAAKEKEEDSGLQSSGE